MQIRTNAEGLKKVSTTKSLRVGWVSCHLDTKIHISCCQNCGLLGHSAQKCTHAEGLRPEEDATGGEKICRDCSNFNRMQEETRKTTGLRGNKRPTSHSTGSGQCPTLIALKKKALPIQMAQTAAE